MDIGYSCLGSFIPEILKGEMTNLQVNQEMLSEIVSSQNVDNAVNVSKLFALK